MKQFGFLNNQTIVFTESQANVFAIISYFEQIVKKLDRELNQTNKKAFLDFVRSDLLTDTYENILKKLEKAFQCKIVIK